MMSGCVSGCVIVQTDGTKGKIFFDELIDEFNNSLINIIIQSEIFGICN